MRSASRILVSYLKGPETTVEDDQVPAGLTQYSAMT